MIHQKILLTEEECNKLIEYKFNFLTFIKNKNIKHEIKSLI
jgi:hypothetical protein